MRKQLRVFLFLVILLGELSVIAISSPLMIEEKEEFLEKIKTKNMAVIFYGDSQSEEYRQFQNLIPSSNQLFEGLEFLYIPMSKFKLNRPSPSLSIYRKIGGGDWQLYKGSFNKNDMDKWIRHNIIDPLKDLTIEYLEQMLRNGLQGFILLSYGQFELIRTKIYLQEFCAFKNIKCWKVQMTSPIYNVVTKLMGAEKSDQGQSKLAFYNSQKQRMELYTHDIWMLKREQLLEMYQGRQGIIHSQKGESQIQIELHYQQGQEI